MEIWEIPARRLVALVKSGEMSARDVVDSYLARMKLVEPEVSAYTSVLERRAKDTAARIDEAVRNHRDPGRMAGLPCAVKDNIHILGAPCTCASKILEGYISPYDATCVRKMREEGAIFLGKTNLDEFAMGSSTETSAFPSTTNPWDVEKVPGGSSGGSAAAVASGMAAVSLGSDTGGSIRQPASFTATYGLKPTYGRVSRHGLVAYGSSLDQVGPFGQSTWDCALVLEIISGADPLDVTASVRPVPQFTKLLDQPVTGLRVGVPKQMLGPWIAKDVLTGFQETLGILEDLGVVVDEVSLPSLAYALDVYAIIATAEAATALARFDGTRYGSSLRGGDLEEMYTTTRGEGFGPEVKRRIMRGTLALLPEHFEDVYLRAARIRTLMRRDFARVFEDYDLLVSPGAPGGAFRLGEGGADPEAAGMDDMLTVPVNLAGIPALTIPCGLIAPDHDPVVADRSPGAPNHGAADIRRLAARSRLMPFGIQIMGRPFEEATVLALGTALESVVGDGIRDKMAAMRRRLTGPKEREIHA